ncbi:hypothetical protein C8Q77DRAFT_168026 [Trametes polyzona]|nr:hypothetical protein C8Q77DRAFT_168026 [Trametes polyzona]
MGADPHGSAERSRTCPSPRQRLRRRWAHTVPANAEPGAKCPGDRLSTASLASPPTGPCARLGSYRHHAIAPLPNPACSRWIAPPVHTLIIRRMVCHGHAGIRNIWFNSREHMVSTEAVQKDISEEAKRRIRSSRLNNTSRHRELGGNPRILGNRRSLARPTSLPSPLRRSLGRRRSIGLDPPSHGAKRGAQLD